MKKIQQIFIGNVLEAFHSAYDTFPKKEREFWKKYDSIYNNRTILYGKDNKLLITPEKISDEFQKYICNISGWKNVECLFPKRHSISICKDIVRDTNLYKKFISIIKSNPNIEIIPYRNSEEFYELIEFLRNRKLKFKVPETTEYEDRFIDSYYHSKRGFRHLWEQTVDKNLKIKIPFGFICENKDEAINAGLWFRNKKKNFVIKYNRGVQGLGINMIDYKNSKYTNDSFKIDLEKLLENIMWENTSIIVEEKINVDESKFGGSPSVEISIDKQGKIHEEYPCEQVLAEDRKTFLGVGINPSVYQSKQIKEAFKALKQIGKYLSKLGYRGYLDMDLVISKDNKVYAVESNLRRTGGTHINEMAKNLLGNGYTKKYYLMSTEIELNKTKKYNLEKLNTLLEKLLFSKQTKVGIVHINPDMAKVNIIPILLIETSKNKLDELLTKTQSILNN